MSDGKDLKVREGRPHVLVLMMYWLPYEGPIPLIYATLFQDLMKKGYRISLVASRPHFRFGWTGKWDKYKGRWLTREAWNGIDLYRVWVYAPEFQSRRFSIFFRILNFISFSISSLLVGLRVSKQADVLFVPSSPPFLAALNAWIIGKLRGIPFVYNIQDLYPENMEVLGVIKKGGLSKLLEKLEIWLYNKAWKITVISERMREIILGKGMPAGKVKTIPNFHDTRRIVPLPKENRFALEHGLQDRFIVSYIGAVSYTHGVEYILEAAEILSDTDGIAFMILGRGEHFPVIKDIARGKALKNVFFLPEQPYERMNEIWAASDASVVCMRKGVSDYQVPSKTFGIMSSGRPVLAMVDERSAIWDIVEQSRGGICVPPERPDLLALAIRDLYANEEKRKEMGGKARDFVVRHYSEDSVADEYDRTFRASLRSDGA